MTMQEFNSWLSEQLSGDYSTGNVVKYAKKVKGKNAALDTTLESLIQHNAFAFSDGLETLDTTKLA